MQLYYIAFFVIFYIVAVVAENNTYQTKARILILSLSWCLPGERILLSLSCLGAYPVARGFVELAMKVKHMIARSSKSSN